MDDPGDVVYVDPPRRNVRGHQNVDFAGPEVSKRPLALGLAAVAVYRPGGQAEVPQMSGHPVSPVLCPHKDHRRTGPANELGAQRSPIGARHRSELMAGSAYFGL
jgi:hypothetical protein